MITSQETYNQRHEQFDDVYYKINTLTEEDVIYVDLNTRQVDTKNKLSQFNIMLNDDFSETIYFVCDRYYDNQDLYQTQCYIAFFNAKIESYEYPVINKYVVEPILNKDGTFKPVDINDIQAKGEAKNYAQKLIIPWSVPYAATKYVGNVQFNIKFYITSDLIDTEGKVIEANKYIDYKLNTRPAILKIHDTLSIEGKGDYDYSSDFLATRLEQWSKIDRVEKGEMAAVTSNAVAKALENISPTITLDTVVTETSTNGVTSAAIYKFVMDAIKNIPKTNYDEIYKKTYKIVYSEDPDKGGDSNG